MRRITVSILSIFVVLPAIGGTRLPVVNIGASGVSARAAFGEGDVKPVSALYGDVPVTSSPAVTVAPMPKKNVVARTVSPVAAAPLMDDEKIASADMLVPHRPSSDLWAKSDAPLRMPTADEVRVVRSDYVLPEESLDGVARQNLIARADAAPTSAPVRTGALDAEIDRLVELQRRADGGVAAPRAVQSRRVISAPIADVASAPVVARAPVVSETKSTSVADTVELRRMVVPMESNDVIVRAVEKNTSPRIAAVRDDMTSMSPSELRKAFRKTYLSENKHLSTYQVDDRFDVVSDMSHEIEGFTANRDLSEAGGVRPLEIKIRFRGDDSALSRDNYNLLTEYAGIVVSNPKRAIQVSIPGRMTTNSIDRKLAARRLAIVEQVLRDAGVSEQRIMPVLSQRDEEGFVLRIISNEQYETLSRQKRDMFGDTTSAKTYKSMSW